MKTENSSERIHLKSLYSEQGVTIGSATGDAKHPECLGCRTVTSMLQINPDPGAQPRDLFWHGTGGLILTEQKYRRQRKCNASVQRKTRSVLSDRDAETLLHGAEGKIVQ